MTSNITAHMIVQNEEQWIWYAINSILPYVAKILLYDTGSVDNTINIIKLINSPKIDFFEKGRVSSEELVNLRNEQIKKTKTDWFVLIDGDEVWSNKGIAELVKTMQLVSNNLTAFVVKALVPVGDLYHYQSEKAGRYHILGRTGHFNIRGYRIKKGYKWVGTYPLEAYVDEYGTPVQNKHQEIKMLREPYWHLTHIYRSVAKQSKRKFEIGEHKNVQLPEVFFATRPTNISSPWITYSSVERLLACLQTPLIQVKRLLYD